MSAAPDFVLSEALDDEIAQAARLLAGSRRVAGGHVIEVGPHESELTPVASLSLRGPGGALLQRLLHHTCALRPADALRTAESTR